MKKIPKKEEKGRRKKKEEKGRRKKKEEKKIFWLKNCVGEKFFGPMTDETNRSFIERKKGSGTLSVTF